MMMQKSAVAQKQALNMVRASRSMCSRRSAVKVEASAGLKVDLRGALWLGAMRAQLQSHPSNNAGKKAFIAGVADDQVQQPLPFLLSTSMLIPMI
jgi:hypothetical protein